MTKLHAGLSIFIMVTIMFLAGGCSKWKSVGEVDMKKIMTPDEIWEKRNELVGKVVTVEFDTVSNWSKCCGTAWSVNGRDDLKATYFVTLPKHWHYQTSSQWEDSINRTRDTLKSYDTIWNGQYDFNYVVNADLPNFVQPEWIKKEKRYINLYNQDLFNNTIVYSPKKYFTGVFIGSYRYKSYRQLYCNLERGFVFLPIGYKYSKGHLDNKQY